VGSCGPKPTVEPEPAAPIEVPAMAKVEHPAQMVSRDTMALVWVPDPAGLLDTLESAGALASLAEPYAALRGKVEELWGRDMISPEAWRANGLDPEAPIGISMGGLPEARVAMFVGVADPEQVLDFLRSSADHFGNACTEGTRYGVPVWEIEADPRMVLVVRDRVMAIVSGAEADDPLVDALASTRPEDSLAATDAFRTTTAEPVSAELRAFVDVEQVMRALGPSLPALTGSQESARVVEQMLTPGVDGVGLALTLFGDEPGLDLRLRSDDTATLRRLLGSRSEPPRLVFAMDDTMLWCAAGQVDPAVALDLLPPALASEDDEFFGVLGGLMRAPADRRTLRDSWSGGWELCGAVDEERLERGGREVLDEGLRISIVLDTVDAGGTRRVMEAVETWPTSAPHGDGLRVGTAGPPLWVDGGHSRLVFSSDEALARRLEEGSSGRAIAALHDDVMVERLSDGGQALVVGYDVGVGLRWLGAVVRAAETASLVDTMGPEAMDLPLSSDSKEAQAKLEKAHADFLRLHPKRGDNMIETLVPVGEAAGRLILEVHEGEESISVRFTPRFGPGGVVGVLDAMHEVAPRFEDSLDAQAAAEVDAAEERFHAAQEVYLRARLKDMLSAE